jgi:mono/diheme cytochrome c family protein
MPSPTSRAAVFALALAGGGAALLAGGCGGKEGADGAALYRAQCARCHGADGRGDPRSLGLYPGIDLTASALVRAGATARVRGVIYQRIADGYGAMPGFSARLDNDQIQAVIDAILRLPQGKAR